MFNGLSLITKYNYFNAQILPDLAHESLPSRAPLCLELAPIWLSGMTIYSMLTLDLLYPNSGIYFSKVL